MKRVIVALGSNLGDPAWQVSQAVVEIASFDGVSLLQVSSLYQSPPMDGSEQDDYINAVIEIETDLEAVELLRQFQALEAAHYRQPGPKNGPRTLDVDIIFYANESYSDSHLTIPHPGFSSRRFVLEPMLEAVGDRYIPGYGSVSYLIDQLEDAPLKNIGALQSAE